MAGYLINKKHQDLSVVNIKMLDGYKFRPKNNGNYINVSEVTIVNHMMIDKILTMKFERTFKRLVAMAMRILNTNDEDTSDDDVIYNIIDNYGTTNINNTIFNTKNTRCISNQSGSSLTIDTAKITTNSGRFINNINGTVSLKNST